jgi:hypothetical protein
LENWKLASLFGSRSGTNVSGKTIFIFLSPMEKYNVLEGDKTDY